MNAPSMRMIHVRWEAVGWHSWPEAGEIGRGYLADPHRHKFHYEATVHVAHNDREVEFHDLLEYCETHTPHGQLGRMSCEDLAQAIGNVIDLRWPGRKRSVSVYEDGEVGATLMWNGD